jgi:hypothetical protein
MSPYIKELIAVLLLSISVLTISIAFNLDKLFTYDSVKINANVDVTAITADTAVMDCSPSIDYPTIEQEVLYCNLKKQYPNCIIFEDFSKKCN